MAVSFSKIMPVVILPLALVFASPLRLIQDVLNASQACHAAFYPGGAHFDC